MIVLIVEKAEPSLRGTLSRWMIQPQTGVFVGKLSARVRDQIWEKVIQSRQVRGALMICQAQNEQGFQVRAWDDTDREPADFEGLTLIHRSSESKTQAEHFRKRGHVQQQDHDGGDPPTTV